MTTAIGPQSANFSTTRPALDPVVSSGAADTWCVNCSTPGATDGTYLDADFFNVIIAQLRTAIRNGGIALTNADDYMLWETIAVMALRYGFTVNTGTPDTAIATLTTPSGSGNPMP